jgi:hypothetical protein
MTKNSKEQRRKADVRKLLKSLRASENKLPTKKVGIMYSQRQVSKEETKA